MSSSDLMDILFDIFIVNRDEHENADAILDIADTSSHRAKMTKAQVIVIRSSCEFFIFRFW